MDWNDIRYFLAAVRGGSLTAASRLLSCHQPTVGRRIDALEQSLGVRLFHRHAQGLTLTDEGRGILGAAESMEDAARGLRRSGEENEIRGNVSIASPEGLAIHVIAPGLLKLHEDFPLLDVTLLPSSASADLIHGEADVAVRLFRPVEGDLAARKIGGMGLGLYGARTYFESLGMPHEMMELRQHRFIGYGARLRHVDESRWLDEAATGGRFLLRSDDTHARLAAAVAGLGLTVLPHFLARGARLRPIAISVAIPPRPIWLVVHRDIRNLARIRAVLDWLDGMLKEISRN
ncbi:MAG: LysR family transcriptional regulator [Thiobacillus sp.]|nr:LysR family transcriptional regulator [Thiobacillus sp.]